MSKDVPDNAEHLARVECDKETFRINEGASHSQDSTRSETASPVTTYTQTTSEVTDTSTTLSTHTQKRSELHKTIDHLNIVQSTSATDPLDNLIELGSKEMHPKSITSSLTTTTI